MLSFKSFLSEAAKYGASGADWEMILCMAYNMSTGKSPDDAMSSAEIVKAKWTKLMGKVSSEEEVMKIAEDIIKVVPSKNSVMVHYGASNALASDAWNGYYADVRRMEVNADGKLAKKMPYTTRTPKTDMYLQSGEYISLKKKGGSQLMSGKDIETWGVVNVGFDAVEEKFGKKLSEELSSAKKSIEGAIIKKVGKTEKGQASFMSNMGFGSSGYTNIAKPTDAQLAKNPKKKGVLPDIKFDAKGFASMAKEGGNNFLEWAVQQLNMQKVIQDSIKVAWDDAQVGKTFKEPMVREAMTGKVKFGDSIAVATDILVFDEENPANSKWHKIDDEHVAEVASKTNFNVSFKTSGTGKTAWSGLKLIYSQAFIESGGDLLTEEELLSEGIILNFIKKWIRKIWDKIVQIAKKSYEKLLEIFNITPIIKISSSYTY